MEIDPKIKQFLEDNKELLASNDFTGLYKAFKATHSGWEQHSFGYVSDLLMSAGISAEELIAGMDSIPSFFFDGAKNLKSIKIPGTVKIIYAHAFSNSELENIEIPNSVMLIGPSAFQTCENLHDVILPNSVTDIQDAAFWNCSHLQSLRIPYSVQYIERKAFFACDELTIYLDKDSPFAKKWDSNKLGISKRRVKLV